MSFGLTIGTERAIALQKAIQDELMNRGYSPDADPVMAEYITIMLINNKTSAQITSELEDLIGPEYSPSFTDWLFAKAAEGSAQVATPPPPLAAAVEPPREAGTPSDSSSLTASDSRPTNNAPRSGLYQQAISQALPSSSSAQKRTASARSPSPSHPNKARRTDLPTGPRAMQKEGSQGGGRNLLDRISGPSGGGRPGPRRDFQRDEIQARIDNIVGNAPPDPNMMMQGGFPGMGMDMNMMAANMANPLLLQEMMVNQMALMAQMATSMGIINPNTGQFGPPGMQGQPGFDGNVPQNQQQNGPGGPHGNVNSRGRGGPRGGRPGRGRGGSSGPVNNAGHPPPSATIPVDAPTNPPIIVAPTPTHPPASASSAAPLTPTYAVPERPQSPTLCKFGLKCTNAHCRWSHPSPVATVESGVVLSNEACENGKDCKDKDCIKAHVSPAVLNPSASAEQKPVSHPHTTHPAPHHTPVPCRFGAACTRPNCTFNHPPRATQFGTQCRFGAACTRANCQFQHPEGRVLPSAFHRGLSTSGGMVNVATPEPGTMGGPSPHKSVTFNNTGGSVKEKLEKQMKDLQAKKVEAEKAVKDAEAAASAKKDEAKSVSITA